MIDYWPWWAGALGLALVTINYTLTTDRSFGVSAAWDRVLHWREERRIERLEEQFTDQRALAAALTAATQEFDDRPAPASPQAARSDTPASARGDAPASGEHTGQPAVGSAPVASHRPAPLATQAALLLSILVGGWVAAVTSGRFEFRADMGAGFREIVTGDPLIMVGVLFFGGVLVGFGTRLAGGCSSGHGLSGIGRLRPVSLLATAVFFGTAALVSFLLWKVI